MIFTKVQEVPYSWKVLGIVGAQGWNCVIEKLVGDLMPYMEPYKIGCTVSDEPNVYAPMEYLARWIWYDRVGTTEGTNPGVLTHLENFITQYQSMGIPVIYHLDDALLFQNDSAPLKMMMKCDKIVVSSLALAEVLLINKECKKPVYILKTHMDLNSFDTLPIPEYLLKKGMFNILFTSSGRIGSFMLRRIVERMDQAPEKYRDVNIISVASGVAQVRSIINEFRNVKKTYYEYMATQEFYGLVKGCQLILAPGEVGELDYMIKPELQPLWLDTKSCTKYVMAGAARIPCIAAPLREYALAIRHKENGFIANNIDEWMEYIDLCLTNKRVYEDIGREARADVENTWDARLKALELRNILEDIGNENLCVLDTPKEDKDAVTTVTEPAVGHKEDESQDLSGVSSPNPTG